MCLRYWVLCDGQGITVAAVGVVVVEEESEIAVMELVLRVLVGKHVSMRCYLMTTSLDQVGPAKSL